MHKLALEILKKLKNLTDDENSKYKFTV